MVGKKNPEIEIHPPLHSVHESELTFLHKGAALAVSRQ